MRNERRRGVLGLACLVAGALATAQMPSLAGGGDALAASAPAAAYRLEKVADGVFCAISDEKAYYVSNSVVIVGEQGILLVDSGASPRNAASLLQAIRGVSSLPIRYVVLTHFHFDHVFGSGAFGAEAVLVGHEATRELLGKDALRGRTLRSNLDGMPARVRELRAQAVTQASAEKRAQGLAQAEALEAYGNELAALVPLPPTLTFSERLTLDLGKREVRLVHPGRGHTAGDVLVLLPRERIVCTGDFFNGYVGYMGDAYVDEWAESLDRLARLDFETVIPGHGVPFTGKTGIAPVQACLRDLWRQATDLERAGIPAEQAAARIDLRAHASHFPQLAARGFNPGAVQRIYEVLGERRQP